MTSFQTNQENFWAGEFGDEYIDRNTIEDITPARRFLFSQIISRTHGVNSAIEFGANIGSNLLALHTLLPKAELHALEINKRAVDVLESYDWLKSVTHGSFLDEEFLNIADLSFTCGVLIHINPEHLETAYKALYNASRKYVMVFEYYNPAPVTIKYRGHDDKLFKRDFAGEMMDMYPDLELVDYGFVYHRDPNFPTDDMTWFLMEKQSS